ncbi:MAG: cyclic pyranopterin monophosphate synthase MoaC [Rubrivivax sp.]
MLAVARIAAIQGAKRTAELVPLCHPLPITRVAVDFEARRRREPRALHGAGGDVDVTGVEMEALTAVGLLDLRHGQGRRPRHGDAGHPRAGEARRQVGKWRAPGPPASPSRG